MSILKAETVFLWFMIYSFIGWLYETVLCSSLERKFVYRGFLNGPYCPIYGFGALLDIIILGNVESVPSLFLSSVLLTCTLEYFTSWAMEKLFHAKWWDYSHMRFNIHGRVCLLGALAFGTFSVLLIKYLHPFITGFTDNLSNVMLSVISIVLFILIVSDTCVTLNGFIKFNDKLHMFNEELKAKRTKMHETISDLPRKFNWQERRMMSAFPKLSSLHYNETLLELRKRLAERRKRK